MQLDLFTYRLSRLQRVARGHPRLYGRRLRLEMLLCLKEGL